MIYSLSDLLYFFVFPNLIFYFYSRCCCDKYKWYFSIIYTILSYGLALIEISISLPIIIILGLKVLLLGLMGILFLNSKVIQALILSSLSISIFYLTSGTTQSIEFWIASNLPPKYDIVLKYIDSLRDITSFILFTITFLVILKSFSNSIKKMDNSELLLLTIPLLFTSLVEQTLITFIYGNKVIWDTNNGLMFPVVNNKELILLHIFAYTAMYSTLIVFKRLIQSIQSKQTIKLLKQQTQNQEIYVREAKSRYNQTRSFRHDIKNHLSIIKELLNNGEIEKASLYLAKLDYISDSLSFSTYTDNAVIDVLLSSKLTIATQNKINVKCELKIPDNCGIEDIDLCIILANAIDNSIEANNIVSIDKRYIYIYGKLKGNLYLIHIENSCHESTKNPVYGIGLSNIMAVANKYGGTIDTEVDKTVFKLDIILAISQQ